MALAAGQRFGAYEIIGPLGSGGMGEVYRAKDLTLGRQVAIKILSDDLPTSAERVSRFDREARLLASLNHPHIGAIFGREESGGTIGLVLELVEGPTLAETVARPMRFEDARPIALQIIDAVSAAHESGIIHRDLKPANIKVTPDGVVKVLDFGLAKIAGREASNPDVSRDATMTADRTTRGTVLGTAAYMSPEQARGQEVDRRTDIWAFGCILYEMLTGRRAFGGDTTSDVIAAVIGRDPDWTKLPADIPDAVRTLLVRCLTKDPKQRLRDIADARFDLEPATAAGGEAPAAKSTTIPWAIAALLAMVLAVIAVMMPRQAAPVAAERISFVIPPPPGVQWGNSPTEPYPVPAPNGRLIAFGGSGADGRRMWIHDVRTGVTTPVASMKLQTTVAWAPDSASFAYCADGQIVRVNLAGAAPAPIAAPKCGFELSWSSTGQMLYGAADGFWRVDATGGAPQRVPVSDRAKGAHLYPRWSPDGRHFVYLARDADPAVRGIYVASIDGGASVRLVPDDAAPILVAGTDGHDRLLFVRSASLVSQVVNLAEQRVEGDPTVLAGRVLIGTTVRNGAYGATPSLLVHRSGGGAEHSQLVELDRTGRRLNALDTDDPLTQLSLSPDESTLAIQRMNLSRNAFELWQVDLRRSSLRPLLVKPYSLATPVWGPDGNRIAYVSDETGLWRANLLPLGAPPTALDLPWAFLTDWSRDGQWVFGSGFDGLNAARVDGSRDPIVIPGASEARLSPDMKWLAYRSSESGAAEVYVRSFPDGRRVIQVSQGGGYKPIWRDDGRELYFRTSTGTVMAVAVKDPGAMALAEPLPLFTAPFLPGNTTLGLFDYAVSRDGQRFFAVIGKDAPVAPLTVVLNWQ